MLKTVKQTLSFLTIRQRLTYFALISARALSAVLDVLGLGLIALVTGLAATNLNPSEPLVFLGFKFPEVTEQALVFLVVLVLLVFALKAGIAVALSKAIAVFLARLESQKATDVARHLFSGDLSNLSRFDKGELVWATMGSTSFAFSGILTSVSIFVSETALLILIAVSFFIIDPVASIFVFAYFSVVIAVIQLVIGGALKRAGINASKSSVESVVTIDDLVNAYREITIYNSRDFYVGKFSSARMSMAGSMATINFLGAMPRYVVETALMLGVVIFVGFQFLTGQLATGLITVGVFLTGGVRVMSSLLPLQGALAGVKTQVEQSRLSLDVLAEIRATNAKHSSPLQAQSPLRSSAESSVQALDVCMRNISFTYPGAKQPALKNVSLDIKPGQHVAFIGPSGAGKTTLVDLILGLLEPTAGTLIVGGKSSGQHTLIDEGLVSYVPQRPGIVSGTIAENVALGIELENIDEERVMQALRAAHLESFVASLPDGLRSSVGNSGDALSGGQIQRLGLARALFQKPKLIVLDEATSALDASSEASIAESLRQLGRDVTVVVIAHRLSTVQHSDVVFVVEDGKLTAFGSFAHLRQTVPMVAEYVKLMSFDSVEN